MTQIRFISSNTKDVFYPVGAKIMKNKRGINLLKKTIKDVIGSKNHVTFWCRGSSGAIIAAIVSIGFPKSVINHVKKNGEYSHSRGAYNLERNTINIIIDDFSNTGETLNEIYDDMKEENIKVDYVCVIGDITLPRLNFTPKVVIARKLFLDRAEGRALVISSMIEKYKYSDNYKVVKKNNIIPLDLDMEVKLND